MPKMETPECNAKRDSFTNTAGIVFKIMAVFLIVLNYIALIFSSKLNIHSVEFMLISIFSSAFICLSIFIEPLACKKNSSQDFFVYILLVVCCGAILFLNKTMISASVFLACVVEMALKLPFKQSIVLCFAYYLSYILAVFYGKNPNMEPVFFDIHVLLIFLSLTYLCHYYSEIERKKVEQDDALVSLVREKDELNQKLNMNTMELEQTYWDMVETLIGVIEARDNFTGGHSIKVCEYSVKLARKAGLNEQEVTKIMQAAILHDIGKMGIPDSILLKPSALSNEEHTTIMTHPEIGYKILSKVRGLEDVLPMILYHHERVDGTGYPDGLEGDEIPYGAKIIAIADAYDAMTSNRPYRKALVKREAKKQIMEGSGTQFDPELVSLFLEIIDNDDINRSNGYEYIKTIKLHTGIG